MPGLIHETDVAGSRWTQGLLTLVRRVVSTCRLEMPETLETEDMRVENQKAIEFLDTIQQELYDDSGKRIRNLRWVEHLGIGVQSYELPDNVLDMLTEPYTADGPVTYKGEDDILREHRTLDTDGQPAWWFSRGADSLEDNDYLGVYPIPNASYMANKLVLVDGISYVCIKRNSADTAENKPGSGTNWTVYWDLTDRAAEAEWMEGTLYIPGTIQFPYAKTLTLMGGIVDGDYGGLDSRVPDLPSEYYPAMIAGAVWMMKGEYLGWEQGEIDRSQARYLTLKAARGLKAQKNPRASEVMQVYPL